uniref:Uncharacterized protein n=1 Tax=Arundo donax TaxID=35708 RepID=A0A0A8ZA36_ARUDO
MDGSSGIELAMAIAAAREGVRVSILARNVRKLEAAAGAIQAATGRTSASTPSMCGTLHATSRALAVLPGQCHHRRAAHT